MPDDLTKPLARAIYEAHARSRNVKTAWNQLGGSEQKHWINVSTAALAFLGEYAVDEEESAQPLFL